MVRNANITKRKSWGLLLALLFTAPFLAKAQQEVLDGYIQEALANNLVLKQKNVSLEQSLLALQQARSLYLPTSWLEGQYTLAQGGREINIPVGDLLNPVYSTLNQLTGTSKFPQIENVSEQFLPNNFYDVRLKTTVPVYNPELKYNKSIHEKKVTLQENEVKIYKRELVREIKQSYYTILMADKAINIYSSTLSLVNENLRLNQSLLANGKGLPAYVSRAESEVRQVETQLSNSKNEKDKAIAWFNALLNRDVNAPVTIATIQLADAGRDAMLQVNGNVTAREELKQMGVMKDIQTDALKLSKAYHTPRVGAFLDLAAQDFNFKVQQTSFFYLGGVQVTVPLFAGNRNLYKIKSAELDLKNTDFGTADLKRKLEVTAFNSGNNARNNYNNYLLAIQQETSATKYFKLIDRGYKEGINSFIELLDARNQLTQSQLQKELNYFRLLSAMADYERQTATYPIN
ncbi:MAG: TolC family protein [Chitinophagaceae bacterium]